MRVRVDRERCCGSGQCALAVPEVFDQCDEDGTVLLLVAEPPARLHGMLRRAERVCPTGAITLDD